MVSLQSNITQVHKLIINKLQYLERNPHRLKTYASTVFAPSEEKLPQE